MKHVHHLLLLFVVTACASNQALTPSAAVNTAGTESNTSKERAKSEHATTEGSIVGKPAKDSKFAKLKIGMTLLQVTRLIGPPTRQWQHPTDKASVPYYFGPDRWVIQYAYKKEGILTFNAGGDQLLTRIEVNKAE
jgi:hypothetical protein